MSNPITQPAMQQAAPKLASPGKGSLSSLDELDDLRASGARRVVWWLVLFFVLFVAWAWFFEIDEVSTGSGKVIPSSREQVIQSLEGGILVEQRVREGDIVEKGQVLARLDPTRGESSVEETAARYRAALASSVRLRAEIEGAEDLVFPDELHGYPELRESELALFRSRKSSLEETLEGLRKALSLANRELEITRKLAKSGAASNVELLRLQRQSADLELKIAETRSQYLVRSGEELAKADAEVKSLFSVVRGREFSLEHTTLHSPVRGIVKSLDVTTMGGVVPPNGSVMTIVPLDDQLLIEARISPRDIAFIHPGQEALIKVTAYDYAIYGGLKGQVATIAPDTMRDEVQPEVVYYPVFIRTESDVLVNEAGKEFPIVPGMITTADIRTGRKSVWDYLTKPFNKAREALRER